MLSLNEAQEEKAVSAKTVVVYHRADMDGRLGAAIAYRALGDEAFYLGLNYEDITSDEILSCFPSMEKLHLIDYSFKPEIILDILATGTDVVLLDHHQHAVESIKVAVSLEILKEENKLSGNLYVGGHSENVAGCYLAWLYYFKAYKRPHAVFLISTYDTWNKESPCWESALHLNTALYLEEFDSSYNSLDWVELMDSSATTSAWIKKGYFLEKAKMHRNKKDAIAWGGTIKWKGLCFLALNASGNSLVAEACVQPLIHDAILLFRFSFKEGKWKVSMYGVERPDRSETIDLAAIAREYGGGGHNNACGFSINTLPFDIEGMEASGNYTTRGE